jgi:hypothetical protein
VSRTPPRAHDVDDPVHPAPPRLITPQPRRRPRSSYIRFAAAQPNECWQSDCTHWSLADGTDIEILNWASTVAIPAVLHRLPACRRR